MKNGYLEMWDNRSKKTSIPVYGNWLDNYIDILTENRNVSILDLGCNIGVNC